MASKLSEEEEKMLSDQATQVFFGSNPHREGSKAYEDFEKASHGPTIGEARKLGASLWDLRMWIKKAALRFEPFPETDKLGASSVDNTISSDIENSSRLKDRSNSFKMKSVGIDVKSETADMQKARREDYLAKVRKLQVTKDRLSPNKSFHSASASDLHDAHYDPSSELSYGFAPRPEPREIDFQMPASDNSMKKDEKKEPPSDVPLTPPKKTASSSSEDGASQPITMGALAQLFDEKLAPVHNSMHLLENRFSDLYIHVDNELHGIRTSFKEQVAEIKEAAQINETNTSNLHQQVQQHEDIFPIMSSRIDDCIDGILDIKESMGDFNLGSEASSENSKRIADLQKLFEEQVQILRSEISALKDTPSGTHAKDQVHTTAVVGNLLGFGCMQEAVEWLKWYFENMGGPVPYEVFAKGDFHSILFLKFKNTTDRDTAISLIQSLALKREDKLVWSKIDQPLPVRVQHSFLYGLRKLLLAWGFDRRAIQIDEVSMILKVGECQVVSTKIIDGKFEHQWHMSWAQWKEFQSHDDVKKLLQAALAKVAKGPAPGKGKGKKSNGNF